MSENPTPETGTARAKMLVFANAAPGRDDEFNEWYDTAHLDDLLDIPGVAAAQRFEIVPAKVPGRPDAEPAHRYLAVYELDGDPEAVLGEFQSRAAAGRIPLSKSMDLRTVSLALWRPRGPERTA